MLRNKYCFSKIMVKRKGYRNKNSKVKKYTYSVIILINYAR